MNRKLNKTKATLAGLAVATLLLVSIQSTDAKGREDSRTGREARNVILMISDGQGFNAVKATEYYTGKKAVYEMFEHKYAMQTYSAGSNSGSGSAPYIPSKMVLDFKYANAWATDSASAATAMYTGKKIFDSQVNFTPGTIALETFFEKAAKEGKSVGAVSSVDWTHATPAAVYGHNASRGNYGEMAREAIYGGNPVANNSYYDADNYKNNLKVVMGPGNPLYDNNAEPRVTPNYGLIGKDAHWTDLLGGVNGWSLITTKAQFEALATGHTPNKVFGMPQAYDTLQYNRTGLETPNSKEPPFTAPLNAGVPDLATMTRAALNVLDENHKGFAIMIEGGAVDWAGHANLAGRLIEEQIDFNNAVEAVVEYLDNNTNGNNWSNTLLIVTADHETGHMWGDGRVEGSTFFDVNSNGAFNHGVDYAHVKDNGVGSLPEVWFHSGSHTNALVPLYAKGAQSQLFKKCVVGIDPNLNAIYNLDENPDDAWTGEYIDNTCVHEVMSAGITTALQGPAQR